MKVKIAKAPIPGFTIGKTILTNFLISPQPSMSADYKRESGTEWENCFIRKIPNGQPTAGKIKAR